jgi:hypothetical protein
MYIHIYLLCKLFFTFTEGKCTKFSFTFTKPSISIFGGVSANGLGFKLEKETPTLVICVFLSSLINGCVH